MVSRTVEPRILGLVLAGGKSRRFGSDKAAAMLGGKPLIEHVAVRAAPQVECLLINRSGSWTSNCVLPWAVLNDEHPGEGPLAGILAGLAVAEAQGFTHLATFSCDTPFFPGDCVARLSAASTASDAAVWVPARGGARQHAFALLKADCGGALNLAFSNGLRSLLGIADVVPTVAVPFPLDDNGPISDPFFNINTQDDLAQAAEWLAQH